MFIYLFMTNRCFISSGYIVSNVRVIKEWLTGRDMGRINRLFRGQFHYVVIRLK